MGRFTGGMGQVLVLNASFEPLNVCTVRRAHVLVFKGKAEVIEQLEQPLRAAAASFPWPHVVRRSRGGESVWENVVTACAPCNLRKGDRSLEESGLALSSLPKPPAPVLFIRLAAQRIPQRWQPYLESFGAKASAA